MTKWLYRQELGYIESMKDITLKELAEQRIGEFTGRTAKIYFRLRKNGENR